MKTGWIKYKNKDIIYGYDDLVDSRLVSWSAGECYLDRCILIDDYELSIIGTGQYWQSDDYYCYLTNGLSKSERYTRRMQVFMEPDSKFIFSYSRAGVIYSEEISALGCENKWFTVELDVKTKGIRRYFSLEKI